MLKKVMAVGLLAVVAGCQCLPSCPKCWTCAIGEALSETVFGPEGVIGQLISSLLGGLVPTT